MTRVLVTGVRGKTGAPLAELLVERGAEVLGGSSDPSTVDLDGVSPTGFSWGEPDGWATATAGVDAVFVVRPDRPDAAELVAALLQRTPEGARVVLLSEQDADATGPDGWAPRVERVVRESGRPWTILRPSWFLQVFTDDRFYRDDVRAGALAFPAGEARIAWIDARDIAAVAAAALLDAGHAGRTYELTGPEALTLPRTAQLIAAASGHDVVHHDVSIEDAVAGMTGFERELTVLTFERVRAGSFATVTDSVEQVTGRPSRSLADFLADVSLSLKV